MLFSLPNLLTLSRILAVPFIVGAFFIAPPWGPGIAFVVFVIAGLTDFLDGYLARAQGTVSKLGVFLDPIADKIMVAAVILMLAAEGAVTGVHIIAAVIIMCREIFVSGLREFLAGTKVSVPVSQLAKWKTAFQMIALGALILEGAVGALLPAATIGLIGLWLAAALTLVTGYDYLKAGIKHMT